MAMVGGLTLEVNWLGLMVADRLTLTWAYSSDEPGKLSQWLCSGDSTINTA